LAAGVPSEFVTRLAVLVVPFWIGERLESRRGRIHPARVIDPTLIWYLLAGGAIAVASSGELPLLAQAAAFAGGAAVFGILATVVRVAGQGILLGAVLLWVALTGLPEAWSGGSRDLLGFLLGLGIAAFLTWAAWLRLPPVSLSGSEAP
jgi:hypothetical protein